MVVDTLIIVERNGEYELGVLTRERDDEDFRWLSVVKNADLFKLTRIFRDEFLDNFVYAKWEEDFFDRYENVYRNIDRKEFLQNEDLKLKERAILTLLANLMRKHNIIKHEDLSDYLWDNFVRVYKKNHEPCWDIRKVRKKC